MLHPAELPALPDIHTRHVRINPHLVDVVGNVVDLAGKLRDPERMPHVGRHQLHKGRLGTLLGAHRHVQFVCHDDPVLGVAILPPELVAYNRHVERGRRLRCVLDGEDHTCGGQEHHDDDNDRDDRPGQLDLRRTINLRRLGVTIFLDPEFPRGIRPQAADHHQDAHRNANYEQGQVKLLLGRRRGRRKHVRNRRRLVLGPGAARHPGRRQNSRAQHGDRPQTPEHTLFPRPALLVPSVAPVHRPAFPDPFRATTARSRYRQAVAPRSDTPAVPAFLFHPSRGKAVLAGTKVRRSVHGSTARSFANRRLHAAPFAGSHPCRIN